MRISGRINGGFRRRRRNGWKDAERNLVGARGDEGEKSRDREGKAKPSVVLTQRFMNGTKPTPPSIYLLPCFPFSPPSPSFFPSFPPSVTLSPLLFLFLCLSLRLSLYGSLSVSLSLWLYLSVSDTLAVYLPASNYLSITLSDSLYQCLSLLICISVPHSPKTY